MTLCTSLPIIYFRRCCCCCRLLHLFLHHHAFIALKTLPPQLTQSVIVEEALGCLLLHKSMR